MLKRMLVCLCLLASLVVCLPGCADKKVDIKAEEHEEINVEQVESSRMKVE